MLELKNEDKIFYLLFKDLNNTLVFSSESVNPIIIYGSPPHMEQNAWDTRDINEYEFLPFLEKITEKR